MRAILPLCLTACCFALTGCTVVYSANPLSKAEDAVEEPGLPGVWTGSDSDDMVMCIQNPDDHQYNVIVFDPNSKLTEVYRVHLVRLNDLLFADMVFEHMAVDRTGVEVPLGAIANHVIVKLNITENELTYSPLDIDAIEEKNKERYYPPLEFLDMGDIKLLTSSTDDMRQFIAMYADSLFSRPDHFTRKITYEAADNSTSPCGIPTSP